MAAINEITYEKACKILNFNVTNPRGTNAEYARSKMDTLVHGAPLRYKVACRVLIEADKKEYPLTNVPKSYRHYLLMRSDIN